MCGYWQEFIIRDPALQQLESFFQDDFEQAERYTPPHITGIVAQQWVPVATDLATKHEDPSRADSLPPSQEACPHAGE
jgi:hypothetical protein